MTLVQLEYIVAVDTWRHFATAAAKCFITQPTLSMQLQKIEAELGVQIFDRSKVPVVPTAEGVEIIQQARVILKEVERLSEVTRERQGEIAGELRLGILPTIAPYLLPLFLKSFLEKYPGIRLKVTELTTEILVDRLKKNLLDAGLVVTPLNDPGFSSSRCSMKSLWCTCLLQRRRTRSVMCWRRISTSGICGCLRRGIACAHRS